MSEIVVIARITAQSGYEQTVETAIGVLETASRQEAGCVNYDVFVSPSCNADFLIHEVWQNEEALRAHGRTKQIADFKNSVRGKAQISVQKLSKI